MSTAPQTLGDVASAVGVPAGSLSRYAEGLLLALRDAVERCRSAGVPEAAPLASCGPVAALYTSFTAAP